MDTASLGYGTIIVLRPTDHSCAKQTNVSTTIVLDMSYAWKWWLENEGFTFANLRRRATSYLYIVWIYEEKEMSGFVWSMQYRRVSFHTTLLRVYGAECVHTSPPSFVSFSNQQC
jgi:hypothetical protein